MVLPFGWRVVFLLLGIAAGVAEAFGGQVSVSFVHAERYTDAVLDDREPNVAMNEIRRHFERLGERYLPPGRTLKVEVLDIDLAGSTPWSNRRAFPVRVLRGVTWPSMRLHYTLETDGSVLLDAEEYVADMNYLARTSVYPTSDLLRHEKRMLDHWFRTRFAEHRPATR